MGLKAPAQEHKEFEKAPAGNHIATCYVVCDLGLQEKNYNGVKSFEHQVRLAWELPNETMQDGRVFSISQDFKLSMAEYKGTKSKLRSYLESWRGKPFTQEEANDFDIFSVCGRSCMLNIVHKPNQDGTRTYANISAVAPLPKGMTAPQMINEPIMYAIDGDGMQFEELPEHLQKKVNRNKPAPLYPDEGMPPPEYNEPPKPDDFDDDINW
jgi:hypothetical protein